MGFPCDIFVNKLSAQYVVVLYRYYFLVLLYCSVIPLHISGGIRVRTSQELNVVAFWSWNLDVVVFWSWDLDVVVCVSPRPRFRFHYENRKIQAKLFQLYC